MSLAGASPICGTAPGSAPAGGQLSAAPESWTKRRCPNWAYGTACLSRSGRCASPVRLEQSWPEAAQHIPRPCHPDQGCVAQTSARRDRGMRGFVQPSNLLSGTTAEATAVVRGGFVRAGQASRSAWVTTSAPASTRSLEGPFDPIFWPQQKIGRLPGRDPARCNESAKPAQGAQTRPAAQRPLRAPSGSPAQARMRSQACTHSAGPTGGNMARRWPPGRSSSQSICCTRACTTMKWLRLSRSGACGGSAPVKGAPGGSGER